MVLSLGTKFLIWKPVSRGGPPACVAGSWNGQVKIGKRRKNQIHEGGVLRGSFKTTYTERMIKVGGAVYKKHH